jgi:ABC-type multidrug transport system ATPase subunit
MLGLDKDLKFTEGINIVIDDDNKFTPSTLQKIELARTLASDADIYILDSPYSGIDSSASIIVEQLLREKQEEGKTVVTSLKFL